MNDSGLLSSASAGGSSALALSRTAAFASVDAHYRLTFDRVNVFVESRTVLQAIRGVAGTRKQILHNVTGVVNSGQVLAIIGASGSGKTTLLNTLSMRTAPADHKSIRLNGEVVNRKLFRRHCTYMPQEDRLWPALTVRENLRLSAALYLPATVYAAEREERVDAILEELGLTTCADTLVGDVFIKGVSGGQKRRASIGYEIVGNPACLFLDEPTSGLDAQSATSIMKLLTSLARERKLLIVCSIHQPATQVFMSFDQVLLLTKGRVGYFGPAKDTLPYLDSIGLPCPKQVNPADHMLAVTNPDFASGAKTTQQVIDAWAASSAYSSLQASVTQQSTKATPLGAGRAGPGTFWRLLYLGRRFITNYAKNPTIYVSRFFTLVVMGIFLGSLYTTLKLEQTDIFSRIALVQWVIAFFSFITVSALPAFAMERASVSKEVANGMYSVAAYLFSQFVVQLPIVFVMTCAGSLPAYWIGGPLNVNFDRYLLFVFIFWLFLLVIESIILLLSAFISDFVVGFVTASALLTLWFVTDGVFITYNTMPAAWQWLHRISPHTYASEGMLWAVFNGLKYDDFNTCLQEAHNGTAVACYGSTGSQILADFGWKNVDLGEPIGVLIGMTIIYRVLTWLVISLRRA